MVTNIFSSIKGCDEVEIGDIILENCGSVCHIRCPRPGCVKVMKISSYINKATRKLTFTAFNFTRHYNDHKKKDSPASQSDGMGETSKQGKICIHFMLFFGECTICKSFTARIEYLENELEQAVALKDDSIRKLEAEQLQKNELAEKQIEDARKSLDDMKSKIRIHFMLFSVSVRSANFSQLEANVLKMN